MGSPVLAPSTSDISASPHGKSGSCTVHVPCPSSQRASHALVITGPRNRGLGGIHGRLDGRELARRNSSAQVLEHRRELFSAGSQADDDGDHEHLLADHNAREQQRAEHLRHPCPAVRRSFPAQYRFPRTGTRRVVGSGYGDSCLAPREVAVGSTVRVPSCSLSTSRRRRCSLAQSAAHLHEAGLVLQIQRNVGRVHADLQHSTVGGGHRRAGWRATMRQGSVPSPSAKRVRHVMPQWTSSRGIRSSSHWSLRITAVTLLASSR